MLYLYMDGSKNTYPVLKSLLKNKLREVNVLGLILCYSCLYFDVLFRYINEEVRRFLVNVSVFYAEDGGRKIHLGIYGSPDNSFSKQFSHMPFRLW